MAEHLIRHERSNCVNLLRKFERLSEQMSQPNHSNVNVQVSPIFGRWQFNPRAASKFLAFQTPDKHETNWYNQHKGTGRTGQDRRRYKTLHFWGVCKTRNTPEQPRNTPGTSHNTAEHPRTARNTPIFSFFRLLNFFS